MADTDSVRQRPQSASAETTRYVAEGKNGGGGNDVAKDDKSSGSRFGLLTLGVVFATIVSEVTKQTTNFGVGYLNNGKFPVPMTLIVVAAEVIKLVVTVCLAGGRYRIKARIAV